MYTVGIITSSDKGYAGEREDKSGEVVRQLVEAAGFTVEKQIILPDDREMLANEFKVMCDELKVNLVLSTGGTGFSKRDWTPEATMDIAERIVPGIPEAMRAFSMQITKRAMLSRATAAIRKETLIINMPGSPKAVDECLGYIVSELNHGLQILKGTATNCARK